MMSLKSYKMNVNGVEIEVTKKAIKNLRLGIFPPDGNIKVSAPKHLTNEYIRSFVLNKMDWILKHKERFHDTCKRVNLQYITGEEHYLWGIGYLLNIIYHKSPPLVIIKDKRFLDLYIKEDCTAEQRKKAIENFYRGKMKEAIPTLLAKWQPILGVFANSWGVKSMKTRWGTCNVKDKRIWLSLGLAKLPYECLEYVVVHELTHLLEKSHGEKFKALLDKFYPSWREIRKNMILYSRKL
jgi:predicted metal-dependent hydrolase